jgi:outer membrane protein OmpA-like peptidoglycan-associated protein
MSGGKTGLLDKHLEYAGILLVLAALIVTAACGAKRVAPAPPAPPPPPSPTLVALLPDPETHVTGRAIVTNEFGSTDLAAPYASSRAIANAAPGAVTTMSEAEVTRIFGAALAALPPAPRHFTLHFKFESDALTDASVALIPAILDAVRAIPVPEVAVVGHTDTMGEPKANVALGLKRAMTVRNILVKAGLAPSTVDVSSHGEADLLVKTRDKTPEPRNRRVEISVR